MTTSEYLKINTNNSSNMKKSLKGFSNNLPLISLDKLFSMLSGLLIIIFTPACAQNKTTASGRTVQSKSGTINVERLATLNEPWGMTFLPDGKLLVTEKPGTLRIYADGKLSEPLAGVPAVAYGGQGGLMDVEIDPSFASNKLVYLYYVEGAGGNSGSGDKGGAVARYRLDGNTLRDPQVIWRQNPKVGGSGHFGGRLVFAQDGKLFITSGERQKFQPAQDTSMNLGRMIRINPDGSIPTDNPYASKPGGRPDQWTMGHRNPLGAAINPATKQLWINEMGPLGGDEINVIQQGKNYGWPIVSNGDHYDGKDIPDHPTRPEFEPPVHFWNPVISPSGMIFYTGKLFPDGMVMHCLVASPEKHLSGSQPTVIKLQARIELIWTGGSGM